MRFIALRRLATRMDGSPVAHVVMVVLVCGLSILIGLPLLALFGLGFYGFGRIGLGRPQSWPRELMLGALLSGIVFTLARFLVVPLTDLIVAVFQVKPAAGISEEVRGNLGLYLEYMVLSVTTAGFLEEFLYRGYLLNRLADWIPASRLRWPLATLVVSVAFGLPHLTHGMPGVIFAFLMSILFCVAYLALGRRLWPIMMAHAFYDVVTITLAYLGWLAVLSKWISRLWGLG